MKYANMAGSRNHGVAVACEVHLVNKEQAREVLAKATVRWSVGGAGFLIRRIQTSWPKHGRMASDRMCAEHNDEQGVVLCR